VADIDRGAIAKHIFPVVTQLDFGGKIYRERKKSHTKPGNLPLELTAHVDQFGHARLFSGPDSGVRFYGP